MSISAIKTSGSSMRNMQQAIDTVAHNIANVNTSAYKEKRINFESVVNGFTDGAGLSGTAINSINSNFAQGTIKATGLFTDLAIQGKGFFTLQNSNGEITYSRNGHFKIDSLGTLVDPTGLFVLSSGGGKIVVPPEAADVEINLAGEINIRNRDSKSFQFLDQLQMANFVNPQSLRSIGNNQYRETLNSGPPEFSTAQGIGTSLADTSIVSGTLENSNADLSTNMVNLITYQRSYQSISKAASTADELLETTLALVR